MPPYSIEEITRRIAPVAEKYQLPAVYLFGSYARGDATADSDVDLLVRFGDDAMFGAQVRLGDEFNSYFGRKVDVVSDRGLSPYIGKFIKKEAVAI